MRLLTSVFSVLALTWGLTSAPCVSASPHAAGKEAIRVATTSHVMVNDNHHKETYDCKEAQVMINGNDNRLTFKGTCQTIEINGNHNEIVVDANFKKLSVNGNENTVRWRGSGNAATDVTCYGNDNKVSKF